MTQTFTFTVKYPPGTDVWLVEDDYIHDGGNIYPKVVLDTVTAFELNRNRVVEYTFKGKNHRRPEDKVYSSKEASINAIIAYIDERCSEMKNRTLDLLHDNRT